MKKILFSSINIITILLIVLYLGDYVLLNDNFLHLSISSIIKYSQHCANKTHLLILVLLPIYVAAIVFGIAIIGYYVAFKIQTLFK